MKNTFKLLSECNFINNIYKNLLAVDSQKYLNTIYVPGKTKKDDTFKVDISKYYTSEDSIINDLRVKFIISSLKLYDKLLEYCNSVDELVIPENIDSEDAVSTIAFDISEFELLVATTNFDKIDAVKDFYFDEFAYIPIHEIIINLDHKNKIYILLYNKYFLNTPVILN